ncbi:cysteine-rich receptor-like protein kinase 29-like [Hibiscus syriacus]|uniref:Cysteine-rich receptor-like protein kinase 29-like n=1 Tax=Hibiscus syriacus TaxID=106335 RepID=A0A6A3CME6_HIBSY|nr:cysteine-rich receptor-like protein kinase 29-like [Hibiscus syriacus]
MTFLHKPRSLLLWFFTIFKLISSIACQSATYNNHACLGPGNETATAGYISNLTVLLDSMSSKASDNSFYNDSLNGIYSLFLCRGDVSSDVCRVCVYNATQTCTQVCPSDKSAIIWYDQCLLQYSDINFFGQPRFFPMLLMWNTHNSTSPEEGNIGTLGLFYSLVDQAPYAENMFRTNEMVVGNGPERRYGLVQCSRDLDVRSCSSCLGQLLNRSEECCIERTGWRILSPSCFIRYEMYPFYNQTSSDSTESPPVDEEGTYKGGKSKRKIIVTVVSSIAGVFASVLVAGFWYYSSSVKKRKQTGTSERILLRGSQGSKSDRLVEEDTHLYLSDEDHSREMYHFNLATIQAATHNFSIENKLGEGGFGPVYKVERENVQWEGNSSQKAFNEFEAGLEEFKNEVKLIFKLQHKNLVRLLGYCLEEDEKLLVYEYMANTSLDAFLFDPEKCKVLDWEKRSNIITGAARGLQYLHEDSRLKIIHRDLKASNVLLDDDMNPKISDFGTARIFGGNQVEANTARVVGTYGYMAPEYALEGLFSNKSDVYSFGVLMLEILSGKKNRGFYHPECGQSLLTYAWLLWNEGKRLELIDPNIAQNHPIDEVLRYIHVALLCVQDDPALRPAMSSVILMLGSKSVNLPQPSTSPCSAARFLHMINPQPLDLPSSSSSKNFTYNQSSTTGSS